jgi:hypothetical protein
VVSAGTFLPAGDLQQGQTHVSASLEMGRVLAGPSDVDRRSPAPQTSQWEVGTWVASDVSVRYGVTPGLALEAQVKLTNPITPFAPELVGGALGMRARLLGHQGDRGAALEVGFRAVGVFVNQDLRQYRGQDTQTDEWRYRALGVEAPLVGTFRFNRLFALTASPFLRAYYIRAVHTVIGSGSLNETNRLDWTPVLSSGMGLSAALQLGPLEIAPGVAVELATRPGPNQATTVLFEPGLSVGTRF